MSSLISVVRVLRWDGVEGGSRLLLVVDVLHHPGGGEQQKREHEADGRH